MPVTLDFHIERGKDGNFSLQVFERNKTQPLARAEFSYDLSYTTEFQISRMDLDTKDPPINGCRVSIVLALICIRGFLQKR